LNILAPAANTLNNLLGHHVFEADDVRTVIDEMVLRAKGVYTAARQQVNSRVVIETLRKRVARENGNSKETLVETSELSDILNLLRGGQPFMLLLSNNQLEQHRAVRRLTNNGPVILYDAYLPIPAVLPDDTFLQQELNSGTEFTLISIKSEANMDWMLDLPDLLERMQAEPHPKLLEMIALAKSLPAPRKSPPRQTQHRPVVSSITITNLRQQLGVTRDSPDSQDTAATHTQTSSSGGSEYCLPGPAPAAVQATVETRRTATVKKAQEAAAAMSENPNTLKKSRADQNKNKPTFRSKYATGEQARMYFGQQLNLYRVLRCGDCHESFVRKCEPDARNTYQCARCSKLKKKFNYFREPFSKPGLKPSDEKGPLPELTLVEKQLIAKAHIEQYIYMRGRGVMGTRGHCLAFGKNLGELCRELPRHADDAGLILQRKRGTNGRIEQLRVRRDHVKRWLVWLKQHCPPYRDDHQLIIR
jgi:hypothetical protein